MELAEAIAEQDCIGLQYADFQEAQEALTSSSNKTQDSNYSSIPINLYIDIHKGYTPCVRIFHVLITSYFSPKYDLDKTEDSSNLVSQLTTRLNLF
jgi:hypothetical protein